MCLDLGHGTLVASLHTTENILCRLKALLYVSMFGEENILNNLICFDFGEIEVLDYDMYILYINT